MADVPQRVVVVNLDVHFWQMVWLIIKLWCATICATIVVLLVGLLGAILLSRAIGEDRLRKLPQTFYPESSWSMPKEYPR